MPNEKYGLNGPFPDVGVPPADAENGYTPQNGASCTVQYYGATKCPVIKPGQLDWIIGALHAIVDQSGLALDCANPAQVSQAISDRIQQLDIFVDDRIVDPATLTISLKRNDGGTVTLPLQQMVSELFFDVATGKVTHALGDGTTTEFYLASQQAGNAIQPGNDGGAYLDSAALANLQSKIWQSNTNSGITHGSWDLAGNQTNVTFYRVSRQAGNAIQPGNDGGAYYQRQEATLTPDYTNHKLTFKSNAGNETVIDINALQTEVQLQGATLSGNTLSLTETDGDSYTVDFSGFHSAFSATNDGKITHTSNGQTKTAWRVSQQYGNAIQPGNDGGAYLDSAALANLQSKIWQSNTNSGITHGSWDLAGNQTNVTFYRVSRQAGNAIQPGNDGGAYLDSAALLSVPTGASFQKTMTGTTTGIITGIGAFDGKTAHVFIAGNSFVSGISKTATITGGAINTGLVNPDNCSLPYMLIVEV